MDPWGQGNLEAEELVEAVMLTEEQLGVSEGEVFDVLSGDEAPGLERLDTLAFFVR